jgi:hypothetical protein
VPIEVFGSNARTYYNGGHKHFVTIEAFGSNARIYYNGDNKHFVPIWHLKLMAGPTLMETLTIIFCLFRHLEVMADLTLMEITSVLCLLGHLEVMTGPTTSICAYYDTFTNNLVYFCLSVNDKEKQRFLTHVLKW